LWSSRDAVVHEQRVAACCCSGGHKRALEAFETAAACAATVSVDELTRSAAEELLPKLFAGQAIRLFSARPVAHDCRCTPERLAGVVRMLGADEVKSLLAEQGHVELKCEFCNRAFRYDDTQVDAIMRGSAQESSAVH
jgi:molecular chaperone Hsp33